MPAVALDLDRVRVLLGPQNVVLNEDHHLTASVDATTALCGATPAAERHSGAPLPWLIEAFEAAFGDAWDDPEDPSRDLMAARWATESPDLCADCGHVLRMALDHNCLDHVEVGGSPGWSGDRCYDPRFCGRCGRTFERVLTFSHRIGGSGYVLDELPDEDADVPLAGE